MIAVTVTCAFCSCSSKITQGEVYDKTYKPAETCVMYIPVTFTNGKSTYTTIQPYIYIFPDRYEIDIRQKNADGEYDTATYYVTEFVFDEINIGDEFIYDEDRDYEEEPYIRKKK